MYRIKPKIALIDSDQETRDQCAALLERCLGSIGLGHCEVQKVSRVEEFVNGLYSPGDYQMIFIDLKKKGENHIGGIEGIECAKAVRLQDMNVPIVFVSSVNDYATETYQVGAAYFVLRPLNLEDCYRMFRHVLLKQCSQNWVLSLPDGFRCVLKDIVYIRQKNNECVLYLSHQQHHTGSLTIDGMDKMVSVYPCLYQIDKETIVNVLHIEAAEEKALRLSNGHYVMVPRKQMEEIRKLQMNLQFRQSIA